MILRRLGNKKKIAKEIQKYFPPHKIYIEPFFGAGGMFFNKPKVKHNFMNDLDSDVFNLFKVICDREDEFIKMFNDMPIHNDLFKYWINNKETDPIKKAIRFIFLSNFSLYGKMDTLRLGCVNPKKQIYDNIDETAKFIKDVHFTNCDFRKMLKSISLDDSDKGKAFIYCDPPYVDTVNNYSNGFTEEDVNDLFNTLLESDIKFALSEFNNELILNLSSKHSLNIITIGERKSLKNRNIEILVTNYKTPQTKLF